MTAIAMPDHNSEYIGPAKFVERVFPISSDLPLHASQKIMEARHRFAKALDVENMSLWEMKDFLLSLENPSRFNHIYPD